MKYIFCSFMFDDVEENIKNSKSPNSVSGHKFQLNMLNGLAENGCDISVVNVPRIRRYPDYKKLIVRKRRFNTEYSINAISIGFLNVQGLNYLTQIRSAYKEIEKIVKEANGEKIVLLVYNTYPAPTVALRKLKRRYDNVIICDVIGDIYGRHGLSVEESLHGRLINIIHNKMDNMAVECDAFALATEEMADALGIKEKPHIVIEGMYEVKNDIELIQSDKKKVFYAGALYEEYGVGHMLRAFLSIKDPSFEFVIAGDGDAVEAVKEAAKKDKRIKYLGFITPKEVEAQQSSASVLVNPRTSEHEYVKYSFASKNLEYLSSGVPYVAHNLPCNPKEYEKFIIYPEDESDAALAKAIQLACNLDANERAIIGEANRAFIRDHKNPKVQMGRLDTLLRSL